MFKLKVKVKESTMPLEIIKKGDWIDLKATKAMSWGAPLLITTKDEEGNETSVIEYQKVLIPLNIIAELPEGYEAHIATRSSTFENFKLIQANAPAIIDNSFKGDSDRWKFQGLAFNSGSVKRGERICQFKVVLSQKATIWQRIKWLFTSGIKFEYVPTLNNENRGGFGKTGV